MGIQAYLSLHWHIHDVILQKNELATMKLVFNLSVSVVSISPPAAPYHLHSTITSPQQIKQCNCLNCGYSEFEPKKNRPSKDLN